MKVAFFNSKKYDKESFTESNVTVDHELSFFEYQLDEKSALLAHGYDVVCVFVNDRLNKETLKILKISLIFLKGVSEEIFAR